MDRTHVNSFAEIIQKNLPSIDVMKPHAEAIMTEVIKSKEQIRAAARENLPKDVVDKLRSMCPSSILHA